MKKAREFVAALAAAATVGAAQAAVVSGTDDLLFVTGSGSNQASLVIDFNDGLSSESFAWGYRWDGVASGAGMLLAVAAADPNLSITSFGTADSGFFLTQISYFDGVESHSASGGTFATFPDDYVGWGYYLAGGTAGDDTFGPGGIPTAIPGDGSSLPGVWTTSPSGASLDSFGETGRILADGAWDAWSFGPYDESFSHQASPGPEAPRAASVPDQGSTLLLGLLSFALLILRPRSE